MYHNGGGANVGGLSNGNIYYAVVKDETTIKLASSYANATASTPVTLDLTLPAPDGALHSVQPAFDQGTGRVHLGHPGPAHQ